MEGLVFMTIIRPESFGNEKKELMRDNMKSKYTPSILVYACLRYMKADDLGNALNNVERAISIKR